MSEVGHFGKDIVFSVSSRKAMTFQGFTQEVSARWGAHSIIGRKPLKEFNGPDQRKISFILTLDAMLGVKPRKILDRLEKMTEEGTVEYLVIGGRPCGNGKYYISKISETWDVIYNGGELAKATISVTMEEYN